MTERNLRAFGAVALAALLGLGPTVPRAAARTKKGDKFFKEAQAAEARQQWDRAAELYTQAVDEDPKDSAYLIGMRRARFAAGMEHVEKARQLRGEGNLAEAIAEFQRAILIDPSSAIALQELKRTQEMLAQPRAGSEAGLTPFERAAKEADERAAALLGVPELKPPVRKVGPLKMNAQPVKILYNTVAAIAGVNVVYDSAWIPNPTQRFDVDLPEMSVEHAFEYLAVVTRTFWKPLTATTIFVTEDSANKRRDYTDNVVKTLFVTNASTAQEFNEIQTAVRTITDIRRVYPYVAQKAIVVRGDADAVALAEKLVRDLDKPKSEVVIDVIIMEANSTRTRELAATIATAGATGLNVSAAFSPRPGLARTTGTGAAAATAVPLNNLGRLSTADFTTSLPGALLQAILTDSRTKILNQPQLRASDGQKARLEIGDRIPIASGTLQTGAGAIGVGVNTTFQFQPVGVIVDVTPQVHSSGEVTLHVELEVSTVKQFIEVGGISQPIVGQNRATADLRLREGEVNILAGLTRQQDTQSSTGIPGLVNIPVLGNVLFGNNRAERDRGDLMIALVPHIVRTPDYSAENLRGVFAGYDQQLKLLYAPKDNDGPGGAVPSPGSAPAAPAPTPPPAAAPQATAPQPGLPPAAPPPPPGGVPVVSFNPGILTVNANAPFTVNVQLENVRDGAAITPLRVSWDPMLLRLNDIAPAELLSRDGGRLTSVKDIRNDQGQATLTLTRAAGAPGISGSGAVATLTFVALAPGASQINVTEVGLLDTQNRPARVAPASIAVTIR
jgi:general secretion pathway protein D